MLIFDMPRGQNAGEEGVAGSCSYGPLLQICDDVLGLLHERRDGIHHNDIFTVQQVLGVLIHTESILRTDDGIAMRMPIQ